MKIKLKLKGEKKWKSIEKDYTLVRTVENFAEQEMLEASDIVEIKGEGEFKISLIS